MRKEHDWLGDLEVPDGLWGIHTQRALQNFPFAGRRVSARIRRALALVKKACAVTNLEIGALPPELGGAIVQAADAVASGQHADAFPLPAQQGGAGTSINMNMNEVLANLALELLGARRGDYGRVSPLDHVNLHQSTNDVFPTAVKLACIGAVRELSAGLVGLQDVLQAQEQKLAAVCERHAWDSHALVTAFVPHIGYERCAELVRRFEAGGGKDWRGFLVAELGQELVDRALTASALMGMGSR